MKHRLSILSILAFTFFVNAVANGQMKMSSVPDISARPAFEDFIAKPAFEGFDSGINLKVWIMSIVRDIGGMGVKPDNNDDDGINDTHNVLVQVADENGKIIPDEVVKLLLVTPSGKKESVDLDPKSDQYGGSVAFTETGEYQLTVSVNADGKPAQRTFNYKVTR